MLHKYKWLPSTALILTDDFNTFPFRFFDITPLGLIINRFSADTNIIDQVRFEKLQLPPDFLNSLSLCPRVLFFSAHSSHPGVFNEIDAALTVGHRRDFLHHSSLPHRSHSSGRRLLLHPEVLQGGLQVSPQCIYSIKSDFSDMHSKEYYW